jgi:hypothetical protein
LRGSTRCLSLGVRRRISQTAEVLAHGHADVALFAPRSSPRVAHYPVLGSGVEADDGNSVVEGVFVGGAGGGVKDALGVEHEVLLSGDGDGDDAARGGGLERSLRGGNVGVARASTGDMGLVEGALAIGSLVGVRRLRVFTMGNLLDVVERVVHETAVAALVAGLTGAVDKLLLGKVGELAGLLEVGAFERGDGGESPAGAALALVLHGVDAALGAPIDSGGDGIGGVVVVVARPVLEAEAEVHGLELLPSVISELVDGKLVGLFGTGVVGLDVVEPVLEDGETRGKLLDRFVGLAVLLHKLSELEPVVGAVVVEGVGDGDGCGASKQCCGENNRLHNCVFCE